jgi:predicted Rossmann fold nucleotide-binding protein DprA/Smf involved in DNA uptake
MSQSLSANTQAILLLTAPLIAGGRQDSPGPLTPGEYKKLARHLRDQQRQPADLLAPDVEDLLKACPPELEADRIKRLLARGFQLSQAVEHWSARAIWVMSRADADYPARLKSRLKEDAPAILYGCGEKEILDTGGLAVVGSREVSEALIEYTQEVGRLAAEARRAVVSGGARGIDQAAMRGALEAGGKVAGVLADSLEKVAMDREHRSMLMDGRLVLISPYDPGAGFNVGNAMQRNKLIYALADAALVVNSDFEKGGTWAGAVEQMDKLKLVPVYVRWTGELSKGLHALRQKGALPWPEPSDPEAFNELMAHGIQPQPEAVVQNELAFAVQEPPGTNGKTTPVVAEPHAVYMPQSSEVELSPSDELFTKVRELLLRLLSAPMKETEVATRLKVTQNQARQWLQRLVREGALEKQAKPVRYVLRPTTLFDDSAPAQVREGGPEDSASEAKKVT